MFSAGEVLAEADRAEAACNSSMVHRLPPDERGQQDTVVTVVTGAKRRGNVEIYPKVAEYKSDRSAQCRFILKAWAVRCRRARRISAVLYAVA